MRAWHASVGPTAEVFRFGEPEAVENGQGCGKVVIDVVESGEGV